MTWAEFGTARQVLTEERIGRRLRRARAREDASVAASAKAIRETQGVT